VQSWSTKPIYEQPKIKAGCNNLASGGEILDSNQ
jgi:hypothetical protein